MWHLLPTSRSRFKLQVTSRARFASWTRLLAVLKLSGVPALYAWQWSLTAVVCPGPHDVRRARGVRGLVVQAVSRRAERLPSVCGKDASMKS